VRAAETEVESKNGVVAADAGKPTSSANMLDFDELSEIIRYPALRLM
jgi:hypothetical protein